MRDATSQEARSAAAADSAVARPAASGPEPDRDGTAQPAVAGDAPRSPETRQAVGSNGGIELPAPARRAEVARFDVIFALTACLGELVVVALALQPEIVFAIPLALHLLLLTALTFALYRRRRVNADLSAPLLVTIAVSAAGPVGALASLVALLWLRRPAQPPELLDAWYRRIALSTTVDPVTQLSDRVAYGRGLDARSQSPEALVAVIRSGSLEERQAALGLIARFFHMSYLAALADALRSQVPVIRVQAAAVASRIRPRLAEEVKHRLAQVADIEARRALPASRVSGTPGADRPAGRVRPGDGVLLRRCLELIGDFDAAVASHLLDKPLEDAARTASKRLAAGLDVLVMPLRRRDTIEGMARLNALEAQLLGSGEFRTLRLLRRRRRLAGRGYPRVRRWPRRHEAAAGAVGAVAAGGIA